MVRVGEVGSGEVMLGEVWCSTVKYGLIFEFC